ncbi:MAG: hypothetical protein M3Y23_05405 [Actinomycetota bacterium]|nr:hypothetical protein [Actinomycetota bacterium]
MRRSSIAILLPLIVLFAGLHTSGASAAPKVQGPKQVKPGKKVKLRASGFPKRSRVSIILQPTANRDGNGFGIALKKRFKIKRTGKVRITFRMPKRYLACAGAANCSPKRWQRRSKVDINVCSYPKPGQVTVCARKVARIR